MNRNYKVIWNRSLGCFTAVAEYAKSRGKSSKSSVSSNATINTTYNLSSIRIFRTTTIWLGLITAGFSMQAIAASCTGATSVECGTNATASLLHGVAIGKNATAQGSQAIAIGGGSNGQNTTASGEQSIAIGANVVSSGNSSIAIGGDDLDEASNVDGVNALFDTYTGGIGGLVTVGDYSGHTQSLGAASVAIGVKARSEGALSTAVGVRSSSTGDASSAFGMGSSASKDGSVALGAGSTTFTNATKETTMMVGGKSYKVAGHAANAGAQVSVGSKGMERQIKHVAAGAVNKDSTDAVNGSQLNATNQSINDLSNRKITFAGDSGTPVARKLGETVNIKGGATTTLSDNNIGVVASSPGTLTVKLAENLTGLNSVTTGNTVTNNDGVKVDDSAGNSTTMTTAGTTVTNAAGNTSSYGANGFIASDNAGNSTIVDQSGMSFTNSAGATGPSITAGGINAGNTQITNVTSGGDTLTNAANIGDVKAAAAGAKTEVKAGTNVTSVTKTTGNKGQDIYTVNANSTTVSSTNTGAITVTAGTKDAATNSTDFAIDLGQNTKDSLVKADSAMQNITTQIDGTAVKILNKDNNTANFVTGNNIVLSDDNGSIKVATAENITVKSVTTGNTSMNSNGITIAGGPSMTLDKGINAAGRITGVEDGADPKDAVNYSQLMGMQRDVGDSISALGYNMGRSIDDLGYRIDDVEDNANAGISAAMAMSSLPQSNIAGRSMIGGGIASYNGESAVAIGMSRVSDNGRWVIKVNGTADTQGNAGGAIGAGFHF